MKDYIDAETARAILDAHFPEELDTGVDEENWLYSMVQLLLVRDTKPDRGRRIAELHGHCVTHIEDTAAHAEHERLLQEIISECQTELERRKKEIEQGKRKDIWT